MNDQERAKVFAKNLRHYIEESGKSQKEVAKALGFNPTTFNTWCMGKILPSLGKVQIIADYFNIGKSNLLEENPVSFYLDDNTAKKAQELFEDRNMRILFDAAQGSRPEDLQMAADLLLRLKGTNPDE